MFFLIVIYIVVKYICIYDVVKSKRRHRVSSLVAICVALATMRDIPSQIYMIICQANSITNHELQLNVSPGFLQGSVDFFGTLWKGQNTSPFSARCLNNFLYWRL